ncbi:MULTISPECIES: peptide chain release factor 1 [Reichenbachiella]|uniref:Peptide chain release factor 1 n=1 Tax=Reichenbachiella agariperforans TaxID=156994 RepID=A0A1M6NM09_REIAG|nr:MULTISPECIES: peptide chain release factor 1 [Reichenbachiella]MBU2915934.1 peptide chain release factor 1 [Reichenbachiella agariperforans]RJE71810.1 peptide chain release factor 1 [Reichenbachiella sp. MSK19-1]SHJ96787.1 peptide chain release factor 1 [Reichenbachiella agariperforans]
MIDKLEEIKHRFEEVGQLIVQPEAMNDMSSYSKLSKEYKDLEKIVKKYDEYSTVLENLKNSKEILETEKDPEFRELAKMELEELDPQKIQLEEDLKEMLIPKDPNDDKNSILEIRAGAGGDEAAIFAGDLFRMYQRYAEKQGWKLNVMDLTEGSSGGYKEIISMVTGEDVYGKMKFESGVHRVQRVPATETQGRVHTSAATVAVLPEMEEVDVQIDMNDVRKDTFCSSGPGGQSVNTTYSAIRLTHIPTGLVVSCQDEKSQLKNLEKALKVLRGRIYDIELKKHNDEVGAQRKSMVGSGDRSDKIRTYNYAQGRVTDHRIGYSQHNLPTVMDGEIGNFIEELRIAENAEKMKDGEA